MAHWSSEKVNMLNERIGFIGAGQMATALAKGFVSAGLVGPKNLMAADSSDEALRGFADATGSATVADNRKLVEAADVIFLAVKPQHVGDVFAEIGGNVGDKLVVSIAAGVRLDTLASGLGDKARLVRVMPNTPCLVGRGASGYCLGPRATAADGQLVNRLLSASGAAFEVPEKLLDAVTGLSGSGPAFVFMVIEALSDGGVSMGLPRQIATALAAHTVRGAAELLIETGRHPGQLKDSVASPGGTTIAGIQELERGGLRATLIAAVQAAAKRSAELGRCEK